MKFKHDVKGDVTIVILGGKIMGGPDFEKYHAYIKELIAEGHMKYVFNFEKVDWINSTGIGIIMSAYNSIKSAGGTLAICGANKRVSDTYYVLQLDKIFDSFDDCKEAFTSLSN